MSKRLLKSIVRDLLHYAELDFVTPSGLRLQVVGNDVFFGASEGIDRLQPVRRVDEQHDVAKRIGSGRKRETGRGRAGRLLGAAERK